jgi:hypothetical protein
MVAGFVKGNACTRMVMGGRGQANLLPDVEISITSRHNSSVNTRVKRLRDAVMLISNFRDA